MFVVHPGYYLVSCSLFQHTGVTNPDLRSSVADPDPDCHFDPDPDPACHFDANPDLNPSFQIKDQNLKKVLK
jgi:hypothetical protein